MKMKRLSLKYILLVVGLYLLFGFLLFIFQRALIYHPDNQDFYNCPLFEDYEKISYNETRFYFKNISNRAIIYYHGNAGSACDRGLVRKVFESLNYSIIFVEYAGYSNDDKKPSKKLLLNDVRNIDDFLNKNSFENNILYGKSIGTGLLSYHASISNPDKIILVSPFSSLSALAQSKILIYPVFLLLRENYDNIHWLSGYKNEIYIIHGSKDEIIPKRFSKILYNKLENKNKEYILINNYGHNDLWMSREFQMKVREIIASK